MINFPPIKVAYEDKDVLIIDKPAGFIVNRSETAGEKTIQDWVEKEVLGIKKRLSDNNKNDFTGRSGIVHRLDKETSGLLIIAKNGESFTELQRQFKEREIEKKYYALVHGLVKPDKGEIRAPISRNPFNRERFGVFLGGKEAVTFYQVLNYYQRLEDEDSKKGSTVSFLREKCPKKGKKEFFSLVEVLPKTGRTHQIRVHFKYAGFPLVSDSFYAGRKVSRKDRQWCPRLFLHAFYLKFKQPKTKKEIVINIDLPPDLSLILRNFLVKYK